MSPRRPHGTMLPACGAVLLIIAACASGGGVPPGAIEKWADPAMPVTGGLALWLDATRQPAAWAAHRKGDLIEGEPLDVWYDASGHARHLAQPALDAQPRYLASRGAAVVRFDGENDHVLGPGRREPLATFTAVIYAAPRSNGGDYRAFLAAHEVGHSDFQTGFNVDLGKLGWPDDGGNPLNVEGRGFGGAVDLSNSGVRLGRFQTITVTAGDASHGVTLHLNDKPTGRRDRKAVEPLSAGQLVVAARVASVGRDRPHVLGFLDGDVAEVLLYDRALSAEERVALQTYLARKHAEAPAAAESDRVQGDPLARVEDPPEVQVFVPGFAARRLPVELTNVNNVRYREDGKLVALAYNGNVFILSDTDGDGLEDKSELFWKNNGQITSPIGMALTPPNYPRGRGLFVANKGKLSLIVDTDGDDEADQEVVVAGGWEPSFTPVDSLGVAIGPDGSIYFGRVTPNFMSAYLVDDAGEAKYDLRNEGGTILKVSPDFSKREIVATGIRVPVAMAFNRAGDLFSTDQEGATWLPNGNPFDELLHVRPGRHYGFPPRHPKHLPGVVDEPSTFDYAPQHQSTCGLLFNEGVRGGPALGPAHWHGDALVCGQSRGKLYRTKLVKTDAGYVARNVQWASLPMSPIDACLSPNGDLVVTVHSGNPDWGSGPEGKGRLYKISYRDTDAPQPLLAWAAGVGEVRVTFDRPLDPARLTGLAKGISIDSGPHVGAGDRFEKIRPGYAIVKRQVNAPRHKVPVHGVQVTPDGRTLVLATPPRPRAVNYAVTLPGIGRKPASAGEIAQHEAVDLAYDLTGLAAQWQAKDGERRWSGWLPHADLAVARAFTAGSGEHEPLWKLLSTPGRLTLRTSLDLSHMLRPRVQPGSRLDYTLPPEQVTVTLRSNVPLEVRGGGKGVESTSRDGSFAASVTVVPKEGELLPLEVTLVTNGSDPTLSATFSTKDDDRARPIEVRRFFLPWARVTGDADDQLVTAPPPELKGGDWHRGRQVFFGNEAGCAKCHQVRGEGSDLGPDLSNLIHRDYESVLRDIRDPSGAINPDFTASTVKLKKGPTYAGLLRDAGNGRFVVRGDYHGEKKPFAMAEVDKVTPSKLSIMPSGIAEGLGEAKMRDLMTFLLTEPTDPAAPAGAAASPKASPPRE